MIKYYLFGLIKFVVESKKLQAVLIIIGGIAALIFVPYWIGAIAEYLMGITDIITTTWALGAVIMLIGLVVGAMLFNIYREILAKLERMVE